MDHVTGATSQSNDTSPTAPPKRRRLKHPRTARACAFCRRRKVRCTGTQPCNYCHEEGVQCEYDDGVTRPRLPHSPNHPRGSLSDTYSDLPTPSAALSAVSKAGAHSRTLSHDRPHSTLGGPRPSIPRGPPLDPPEAFAEGQHIGPTAGVSFLYHVWNRSEKGEREATLPTAPLTCHGDMPQPQVRELLELPTREEANVLLERYFRFATPTYRFLHRPSMDKWASHLLNGAPQLMSETACVLLAFGQSLLYSKDGDRYQNGGDEDLHRSTFYFERARSLLNQEPGPASISSVQARLALCLYLLSTFRINECRFAFSMACATLTSIGLHRITRVDAKIDHVILETRKRTFWCAYVLDGYLSVMLGQPRMLRDQDIDQLYPRNIDDQDLLSAESPEELPLHGNLEAFIAHAELAKLMGRNNDLLYPLRPLTEDQVLDRTSDMLEGLFEWSRKLPDFLKPREKTLTGQRTFERQNTILKLAQAHVCILVTRRCLLADFSSLGGNVPLMQDERAIRPIQECASAISTILSTTHDLIQRHALYQAFWFTHYIALVAISTLYVFIIQKCRSSFSAMIFPQVELSFEKAKQCQEFLAALSPNGSQARRHYDLLDRLRARAEKDASRAKLIERTGVLLQPTTRDGQWPTVLSAPQVIRRESNTHDANAASGISATPQHGQGNGASGGSADVTIGQFTPSEDDFMFQSLLKWDWENLDTVGFPGDGDIFTVQS